MIRADACAKIILCGEHAVVYGQPAIAMPVSSLRAVAAAEPADILRFALEDLDESFTLDSDSPIASLARQVCETLHIAPPPLTIRLKSAIPIASGLGSGAAIAAAVARVLFRAAGQSPDNERINALVYESEKLYHGTPSGIDNTVVVYEQPVYFIRDKPIETIKIQGEFHFIAADTGIAAPTKISVGDVRRLYESGRERIQPILEAIGVISRQVRAALESGDAAAMGKLMFENHVLLQQLTVSSLELDHLVEAALKAGAMGAKLSGGGRGGNMIALVTPDTAAPVKTALLSAGAVRVFETGLSGTGA